MATRYTIMRQGVPVGETTLDLSQDPAVGIVAPLAGYDAVRELVRGATRALRASGFPGSTATGSVSEAALARGAALGREFELRDERAALVTTDFIELADWEGEPLGVTVWIRARGALSINRAAMKQSAPSGKGGSRPDA